MPNHINGSDFRYDHPYSIPVFKMELQRIIDMNLEIDPLVTEYMRARISEIEPPTQN